MRELIRACSATCGTACIARSVRRAGCNCLRGASA